MKNQARDYNLLIYNHNDLTGHVDHVDTDIFGVEIPAERVNEVATAISQNREKYRLGQGESSDAGVYINSVGGLG